MTHIITTTQLQQEIGKISANIGKNAYIVTNKGKGRMVLLPYFDGCDRYLEDYMEDYEMYSNKDKLQKRLQKSLDSGPSDLII